MFDLSSLLLVFGVALLVVAVVLSSTWYLCSLKVLHHLAFVEWKDSDYYFLLAAPISLSGALFENGWFKRSRG